MISWTHCSSLLGSRQLPVEQQVSDFEIGRLLGQLLDRVAAVLEDPLVAVDEGDRALGCGRGRERRVVEPDARKELAPLLGRDPTVDDRDLDRLAVAVIRDRHALCHDFHLLSASAGLTPSSPGLRWTNGLVRRPDILRRSRPVQTPGRQSATPEQGPHASLAMPAGARARLPGNIPRAFAGKRARRPITV